MDNISDVENMYLLRISILSLAKWSPLIKVVPDSVDPDQRPQKAASDVD